MVIEPWAFTHTSTLVFTALLALGLGLLVGYWMGRP